jgi:hypothetical protein
MPSHTSINPSPIANRIVSDIPKPTVRPEDRLGVFDIADTIQRLCDEGIAASSIGLEKPSKQPTQKGDGSPARFELDVLATSFLQDLVNQLAKHHGFSFAVCVVSQTGRMIQTADCGWRDGLNALRIPLLNKIAKENLLQPAPRFSMDVLDHIATLSAANQTEQSRPVAEEATPSTDAIQTHAESNAFMATIRGSVCVNDLSKSLDAPLYVLPVALPNSKCTALFVCDASACLSQSTLESFPHAQHLWVATQEWASLVQQLDAWSVVHRCNRYLRVLKSVDWFKSRPRWWLAVALLASCSLFAPVPYYPKRECVFEPETKQFLSSPIQGRIASCEVRPGDRVESGQLLARLDDDELRRELATAQAEYEGAQKKRDSALATRAMGSKGIADVEMQQALWRIESIQDQLKRLEIRANAPGVVVQGDWQRNIGMPLTLGQSLFEVAMLESMTAEVRLHASDLGHINVGDEVTIRSDASGGALYTGKINRIEPRATIIDEKAVFVADVVIHDPQLLLRPGMKASAQIQAGWKSLGWILFDKPYRWLANQWIW